MAGFLTQDWEIPPEMEAELERMDAEEPLPDPDEENQDEEAKDGSEDDGDSDSATKSE